MIKEGFRTELQDSIQERMGAYVDKIMKLYMQNYDEINEDFFQMFCDLANRCHDSQQEGKKGTISTLCIYMLRSSFVTSTNDIMLSMLDEHGYADQIEMISYWKPTFLLPVFNEECKYIETMIKNNNIRVMQYEIDELLRENYISLMKQPLKEFLEEVLGETKYLKEYENLEKTEDFSIMFGELYRKLEYVG